ncbi:MAG: type II toxin-antitoxin system VapC family toxin [Bacteroidota bacterium]|nr:type II toxin-antitoxin system VapC family toxin [Bacteroidota bacterium]
MGKRYLIDTNVVLDFMGNKLPNDARIAIAQIIANEINLSVINKIELLGFSKIEQDLVDFVKYSNIIPMSDDIIEKTIEVRRKYKIKLPDAVIAATAIISNYTLVTSNIKDFKSISDLEVLNPGDI